MLNALLPSIIIIIIFFINRHLVLIFRNQIAVKSASCHHFCKIRGQYLKCPQLPISLFYSPPSNFWPWQLNYGTEQILTRAKPAIGRSKQGRGWQGGLIDLATEGIRHGLTLGRNARSTCAQHTRTPHIPSCTPQTHTRKYSLLPIGLPQPPSPLPCPI